MNKLIMRDVGDGLNLLINNSNGYYDLTVDFGGDKNIDCYCYFHGSFLLTHFHADHYNGILNCCQDGCPWELADFYFPAMPEFDEAQELYKCLLAMNIHISKYHPIQNTIMRL